MPDAIVGAGTKLEVGDGASPEVFSEILGVTDLNAGGIDAPPIDTTTLKDTWRQFKQQIKNQEPLTFTINWDQGDTQHQNLRDRLGDNTARNYKISNSESPALTIVQKMYVSNLSPIAHNVDGVLTRDVTLQPDGTAPTYTDS